MQKWLNVQSQKLMTFVKMFTQLEFSSRGDIPIQYHKIDLIVFYTGRLALRGTLIWVSKSVAGSFRMGVWLIQNSLILTGDPLLHDANPADFENIRLLHFHLLVPLLPFAPRQFYPLIWPYPFNAVKPAGLLLLSYLLSFPSLSQQYWRSLTA